VAAPFELAAQFLVIVDLAVEDDRDRAVLVPHRLRAAGRIAYRQPPEAKEHRQRRVGI
jgi:hypothetical protein